MMKFCKGHSYLIIIFVGKKSTIFFYKGATEHLQKTYQRTEDFNYNSMEVFEIEKPVVTVYF